MLMKAILGKMLCFGVLGASLVAWTGCLKEISDSGEKDDRINVWVAIPPQAYFLKAVGGEDVRVTVMVPPGTQPEAFTPGKDFMERIAHAGLVYGMGLGFEEALFKEMKRRMSWVGVIDTRRIFDYDPGNLRPEQNLDDPHAWMDPAWAEGIGAVYVQPEFGAANATALAEALGVPLVEVDALAEDYMANLRRIADALAAGFSAPR